MDTGGYTLCYSRKKRDGSDDKRDASSSRLSVRIPERTTPNFSLPNLIDPVVYAKLALSSGAAYIRPATEYNKGIIPLSLVSSSKAFLCYISHSLHSFQTFLLSGDALKRSNNTLCNYTNIMRN
jgi:hypothetical protein